MLDHLPERDRPPVAAAARGVGARRPRRARSSASACSPPSSSARHPGAAASLREGLEETLTVTRLGVRGRLKRTLASHEPVRVDDRDRPPHQPQRQALAVRRHVPALDRRRDARSRAPVPHASSATRDLAKLAVAVERDVAAKRATATAATAHTSTATAAPEVAATPA